MKSWLKMSETNLSKRAFANYQAQHFLWSASGKVATITLNRPEKKNPLTFDSYTELRELFRGLVYASDIKVIVLTGAAGNFCSGGDVHEIIAPLTKMSMPELLDFTRMTGDLVKAIRHCPQPIIAAVDGVCAGAGAIILPRIIGQGRASELLYTGRTMTADEGLRWGFYNDLYAPDELLTKSQEMADRIASGPTFAHAMTKRMLHAEWSMSVDEAIDAEADAQAICMQTNDFRRAYEAFAAKQSPVFEGD
jgi:enoyl-CoA hydratase/carnithine racemase